MSGWGVGLPAAACVITGGKYSVYRGAADSYNSSANNNKNKNNNINGSSGSNGNNNSNSAQRSSALLVLARYRLRCVLPVDRQQVDRHTGQ